MYVKVVVILIALIKSCQAWQMTRIGREFRTAAAAIGVSFGLGLPDQALAGSRTVAEIPSTYRPKRLNLEEFHEKEEVMNTPIP